MLVQTAKTWIGWFAHTSTDTQELGGKIRVEASAVLYETYAMVDPQPQREPLKKHGMSKNTTRKQRQRPNNVTLLSQKCMGATKIQKSFNPFSDIEFCLDTERTKPIYHINHAPEHRASRDQTFASRPIATAGYPRSKGIKLKPETSEVEPFDDER